MRLKTAFCRLKDFRRAAKRYDELALDPRVRSTGLKGRTIAATGGDIAYLTNMGFVEIAAAASRYTITESQTSHELGFRGCEWARVHGDLA